MTLATDNTAQRAQSLLARASAWRLWEIAIWVVAIGAIFILPGKSLSLGELGVIDARLPRPAEPTPYSRWGEGPFAGLLVLSAVAWGLGRRRRPRQGAD